MTAAGNKLPCRIDFEASGLHPESYPIEAGWSLPDGTLKALLVSPTSVREWTYWDYNAEYATHHLSRPRLVEVGSSPYEIAQAMNADLEGLTVYSDNAGQDGFWCRALRGGGRRAQFAIDDYWALVRRLGVRDQKRRARKLTQVRMAKALGITQDSVSRLEKRSDLLLSTLRKTIKALGGVLSLVAEFPDRPPVVLSGVAENTPPPTPAGRKHAPAHA